MADSCEGIVVVDTTASIFIGIGKNDDVFVREVGETIVNGSHVGSGKITVGVECAEV